MATLEKSQGSGLLPTPTGTDYKSRGPNSKQVGIDNFLKLTCSPEAFPANLLAQRENEGAQKTTVISGRKCCELLKSSTPLGSLARTLLESSQWHSNKALLKWEAKPIYSAIKQIRIQNMAEELSTELLQTLSKSAIPSNRLLFQLVPSTLHTEETGSGLLRTPDANMERGERSEENLRERYLVKKQPLCLNDQLAMIQKGLIPTPQAADASMGAVIGKEDKFKVLPSGRMRKINKNGIDGSVGLAREVAMLPTPSATDYKGCGTNATVRDRIDYTVAKTKNGAKTGLKLQPNFVEWMMGFPANWTDLSSVKPGIELSA